MKKIIAFFPLIAAVTVFVEAQLPENGGFRQEGIASWYGEEFEGRQTASGEVFDPKLFTAAHPSLAFGTIVTVTNVANNNTVQVRVNDRGPFVPSRIIDVSKAAAEKLDMLATGTAKVIIEVTPRNMSPAAAERTLSAADSAPAVMPDAAAAAPVSAAPPAAPDNFSNAATSGGAPARQAPPPAAPDTRPLNPPSSPRDVQAPVYSPATPPNPPRTTMVPAAPRTPTPTAESPAPLPPSRTSAATPTQIQPLQNQNTWKPAVAPPAPVSKPSAPPPVTAMAPPSQPAAAQPPAMPQAPVTQPAPTNAAPATILGGPLVPGRIYRIQVGSFREASNAMKAYNKLTGAGFNPQWERYENLFRVVLTGVRTEDIPVVAQKLGSAGFKEAVARLEGVDVE